MSSSVTGQSRRRDGLAGPDELRPSTFGLPFGRDIGARFRRPLHRPVDLVGVFGMTLSPPFSALAAALAIGALSFLIPAAATAATSPFTGPPNSPRVYEQVSPVDKNGREVLPYNETMGEFGAVTPPDGTDSVYYMGNGAFPGSPTSRLFNYYIGRRGSLWQSEAVDVPQRNTGSSAIQIDGNGRLFSAVRPSPDLSRTIVFSRIALTPDAVEDNANFYLRDNRTGALELMYTLVSNAPRPVIAGGGWARFAGSDNFDRIFFLESARLTPDAPPGSGDLIYEYRDGEVRLVSPLRSDTGLGSNSIREAVVISRDGSRAFLGLGFINLGFGTGEAIGAGLFMVDEAGDPIPVSFSERDVDSGELRAATPLFVARDGASVVFQSRYPLTEESGDLANLWRIYRYDVETGDIVDLAPMAGVPHAGETVVAPSIAVSEDGEHVYFFSSLALTGEESGGLFHWNDGELTLVRPGPVHSGLIASPDGGTVVWEHPLVVGGTILNRDIWAYTQATGDSTCISCAGGGSHSGGREFYGKPWSHTVADDGSVFFTSPDRLVPQDVNSEYDAYEWKDGVLRLVSSGRSRGPSYFAGASPDGDSVYFTTRERLVGQDGDDSVDLYVARRGGGLIDQFPAGLPADCVGDGCQGSTTAPPQPLNIGSVSFRGDGNVASDPDQAKTSVGVSKGKFVPGSVARLKVHVPGAGQISVAGPSVRRSNMSPSRAGTYSVMVKLTPRAKRVLWKKKKLRVKLQVTFWAMEGRSASKALRVTFLQPKAKRARAKKGGR